ncbi:hypothetical protein DNTS_005027 [Danionella cerebrum]|uniref:Uncharacterized protein n=1 Tax=Danionella cerebrum TaxID=2873325 RepID=A0A553PMU4_9TELE|nr:hypothetical protein DNTS_005027 [Danionella translucida]
MTKESVVLKTVEQTMRERKISENKGIKVCLEAADSSSGLWTGSLTSGSCASSSPGHPQVLRLLITWSSSSPVPPYQLVLFKSRASSSPGSPHDVILLIYWSFSSPANLDHLDLSLTGVSVPQSVSTKSVLAPVQSSPVGSAVFPSGFLSLSKVGACSDAEGSRHFSSGHDLDLFFDQSCCSPSFFMRQVEKICTQSRKMELREEVSLQALMKDGGSPNPPLCNVSEPLTPQICTPTVGNTLSRTDCGKSPAAQGEDSGKAQNIVTDYSHPLNSQFELLNSGKVAVAEEIAAQREAFDFLFSDMKPLRSVCYLLENKGVGPYLEGIKV